MLGQPSDGLKNTLTRYADAPNVYLEIARSLNDIR